MDRDGNVIVDTTLSTRRVTIHCRIAIVGANLERVSRVVELLLASPQQQQQHSHLLEQSSSLVVHVEYLACVAKFGQYYNEKRGEQTRYLISVEYHGRDGKQRQGSSLAPFWDDVENAQRVAIEMDATTKTTKELHSPPILPGISGVAIGCGIERESDVRDIQKFFETMASASMSSSSRQDDSSNEDNWDNNIIINNNNILFMDHVKPNAEFMSMKEEMDAYRQLDSKTKAEATILGSMGPGKMAKLAQSIASRIIQSVLPKDTPDAATTALDAADASIPLTGVPNQPQNVDLTVDPPLTTTMQVESLPDITTSPSETPITDTASSLSSFLPTNLDPARTRYACRICRSVLFGENDLEYPSHIPHVHSFSSRKAGTMSSKSSSCQSLFLACGMEWMGDNDVLSQAQGKIHCPTCSAKLGVWNWSGAQCSCGTWVTPAIQIHISKVDFILPTATTTTIQNKAVVPL